MIPLTLELDKGAKWHYPSFSLTCRGPGLGDQKLGFFRPEILSIYYEIKKKYGHGSENEPKMKKHLYN
jgi:hypothetical protein